MKIIKFPKIFRLKLVTLVKFLIINNSYENEDAKIQYKNVVGKLKKNLYQGRDSQSRLYLLFLPVSMFGYGESNMYPFR